MSAPFVTEIPVRFDHVDAAGVVYYPRYYDYCHIAFEVFMERGFGRPYAATFGSGVGFPAVHTEADYKAPSRFGDVLTVTVTATRVGTRSVTLRYAMARAADGAAVADLRVTVVCVDMDSWESMDLPEAFRTFFESHAE